MYRILWRDLFDKAPKGQKLLASSISQAKGQSFNRKFSSVYNLELSYTKSQRFSIFLGLILH
ncbi:hypothetical protein F280043A3_09930 [Intestinibacter bartlettii]